MSAEAAKRSLEHKKIRVETDLSNEKKMCSVSDSDYKISTKEMDVYGKQIAAQQPKVDKVVFVYLQNL